MARRRFYEQIFGASTEPEEGGGARLTKKSGGLLELLAILLVAFILVFGFVRPFIVEAFWIPSESMVPTLEVGDRVFINKFIYRFAEPEPGDIIVFQSVEGGEEDLIKRVIGLPGDEVAVRNGRLFVNDERWDENYVNRAFPDTSSFGPMMVLESAVFAMGDTRGNSRDSRFFGAVPLENIEGEAFRMFWPPASIGIV